MDEASSVGGPEGIKIVSAATTHGHKKTDAMRHPFSVRAVEPGKLFSGIGGGDGWCVGEAPADFVALGSGTKLALLALCRCLKCAAAAHFFEDALGIQLGLEAFESPVDRLTFFHGHSTHALNIGWFDWFHRESGARYVRDAHEFVNTEPAGF